MKKITKKQLTYLVESEVKKQLKLRGNKNARRNSALRINESEMGNDVVAEELIDSIEPYFYDLLDLFNGYRITVDDNDRFNLERCIDHDTDEFDIDEVSDMIRGAKELTISFYIGNYQNEYYINFKEKINKLMSKYPMYTGDVYDESLGDTPELYYNISVPLNDLSQLSNLLNDLIEEEL